MFAFMAPGPPCGRRVLGVDLVTHGWLPHHRDNRAVERSVSAKISRFDAALDGRGQPACHATTWVRSWRKDGWSRH